MILSKCIITIFLFIATAYCSSNSLQLVRNGTYEVYLESKAGNNTIGYSFTLQQNTLLIKVNATIGSEFIEPASYSLLPNIFIESNGSIPLVNSTSVRGFLDLSNTNEDWGDGLLLSKKNGDVYQIDANWVSPSNNSLNFKAKMFVAAKAVQYQGINLQPNQIAMQFSIIDYPYSIEKSTLSFDQIILTGAVVKNYTLANSFKFTSANVSSLFINKTSIVDGKRQDVTDGTIQIDTIWSKFERRTNTKNISGRNVHDLLISFKNSDRAKNITYEQRLTVDLAAVKAQAQVKENAATPFGTINWLGGIAMLSCFLVALAILVLQ